MEDTRPVMTMEDEDQQDPGPDDLGIIQRETMKSSPDCEEHKKRGRTPNVEKLKLDGGI